MSKVQLIAPLDSYLNVYYVRDKFGRTWHTVADSPKEAKNNIRFGEDHATFKLYTTDKMGESLPQYDFKNLILDMLENMGLQDTYEFELVVGWDENEVFKFFRASSMLPCDLLIEINKFDNKKGEKLYWNF